MEKALFLLVPLLFGVLLSFSPTRDDSTTLRRVKIERVAHAGGALKDLISTNSIEALNWNKEHYRFFEIDFNFTADGKLVCIHDWEGAALYTFGKVFTIPPSLKEFEALTGKNHKFKNCTLDSLIGWLDENPSKTIITDIKDRNLQGLEAIARQYPQFSERFIPQIYHPSEYFPVRQLGYEKVIFTLYIFGGNNQDVLNAASRYDFFAITMPRHRVSGLAERLKREKIPTYLHTINTLEEAEFYLSEGISEIYTDTLWSNKEHG